MILSVRAHPRASKPKTTWDGQMLEVWVTAPALEGEANRAILAAVAKWLRVPRSRVRLVRGGRNRIKVVQVEGVSALPPPAD
ncbi:MAG TPA: DUF167 domain-containing protein [Candidatus Dormibacteraeota bacterium]